MSEQLPRPDEKTETDGGPEKEGFSVICAWCKKEIGKSTVESSQGICEDCIKKELESFQNNK